MHVFLALLYVYLAAAPECTSRPTKGDSNRKNIEHALTIVQITLVHIKKLRTELPVDPQIKVTAPSIDGLTGIIRDLGRLDDELQSVSTELLSQIQADVSSLEGRLRFVASVANCTVQARVRAETSHSLFPDSQVYQTLTKLQCYLENLLLNKDKLKVC